MTTETKRSKACLDGLLGEAARNNVELMALGLGKNLHSMRNSLLVSGTRLA